MKLRRMRLRPKPLRSLGQRWFRMGRRKRPGEKVRASDHAYFIRDKSGQMMPAPYQIYTRFK